MVPHGVPPHKNEAPFQKTIPRKNPEKSEKTFINTGVSIIKQHWKNMAEI